MRFLFSLMILGFLATPAYAQAVRSCGPIDRYDIERVDPDTHDMCDIYARQLDYRLERLRLKEQIEARRENYAIARRNALANYKEALAEIRSPGMIDTSPDQTNP